MLAGEEYKKPYAEAGLDDGKQNLYGCITAMDDQIGRLRNKLRELSIEKNTIIFFCSDNGPADSLTKKGVASAGPFKGHKHQMYEGGLLVPACVEWPGTIEGGKSTSVRCSTVDFYPTISRLVGNKSSKKDQRPIDGIDLMPVMSGKVNQRDSDLFFGFRRLYQDVDALAIISGDWKLFREAKKNGKMRLFNLKQDPYEENDLYKKDTQQAAKLEKKLKALDESCRLSRDGADYRY